MARASPEGSGIEPVISLRRVALVLVAFLVLGAGPFVVAGSAQSVSAETAARLDSIFLDLDRTDTPGCAVGLLRNGELAFADGYGSTNLDHEIPITPSSVFYMGSVSKQFTAAAVALAARQGEISLDDDVRHWVPEMPDYGSTITIRRLVHHTSGIRDYLTLLGFAGSYEGVRDEEVIELLARQKALNFGPGEQYLYSNSGYFLLAEILERATGLSLREYAEREFFGPLGMRDTHFHDRPDHVVRNRATGYAPTGDPSEPFRMNHAWQYAQVGAGGLYSSVRDMARWDAAFEAGRVVGADFRERLLQRGVLTSGDTLDYAFGLSIGSFRGLTAISHGGSLAGFRSHLLRFPDEGVSVMVFCNVTNANPGARAQDVAEVVLGDAMAPRVADEGQGEGDAAEAEGGPEPEALTVAEREAFAGEYYSEEVDATVAVVAADAGLRLERARGSIRLQRVERDAFAAPGIRLTFARDEGSRVTRFALDLGRANGMIFERVR